MWISPQVFCRVVGTVSLILLSGCSDAQINRAKAISTLSSKLIAPTVRMDSGVKVFEHSPRAFDEAAQFVLDTAPVMTFGGPDEQPGFEVQYVSEMHVLSDGRIVAFSSIGPKILIFDQTGKGQRSLVRLGEGPREMVRPAGVALLPGDTMVVPDPGNNRIATLLPDRGVISTAAIPRIEREARFEQVAGVLPNGTLVLHAGGGGGNAKPGRILREQSPISLMDRTGSAHEIARVPALEMTTVDEIGVKGRRHPMANPLRFARYSHTVVWDTLIATGSGEGYRIDLRTREGTVIGRLLSARPRRPVTDSMRIREIAHEIEQMQQPGTEGGGAKGAWLERIKRIHNETPTADSLPPYSRVFVTPNKTLWVVDGRYSGDTSWSATAFNNQGAMLARLHVVGRSEPIAFGDDRVAVRWEDENGEIFIKVFRMIPRGQ
jgi:hypothetical protein